MKFSSLFPRLSTRSSQPSTSMVALRSLLGRRVVSLIGTPRRRFSQNSNLRNLLCTTLQPLWIIQICHNFEFVESSLAKRLLANASALFLLILSSSWGSHHLDSVLVRIKRCKLQNDCARSLYIFLSSSRWQSSHRYIQGYISYPRTESTAYPPSFDLKGTLMQQRNSKW